MSRLHFLEQLRTRALWHVYADDRKICFACMISARRRCDLNVIACAAQPFVEQRTHQLVFLVYSDLGNWSDPEISKPQCGAPNLTADVASFVPHFTCNAHGVRSCRCRFCLSE